MAYTVTDIAELIGYHLVASAPEDDTANDNLAQLVSEIQRLSTRPLWREATWVFCDRCGCSVDTDLIHPDGHPLRRHWRLLLRRLLARRAMIALRGIKESSCKWKT